MGDEDDASRLGDGGFYDTNNIRNRQAAEQWPHGKILESGRRGWKLVAQCVVLHVDSNKVIQTRSREAEDSRYLLGVEEVGGLVPVNPHTAEIIAEQVVQRITRQEAQAVWNPVSLVRRIVIVLFSLLAKLADSVGSLLIGARPDTESNTVESVCRILLEDESVVNAVWLASAGADLDVVRETGLAMVSKGFSRLRLAYRFTRIAACSERAISWSCSNLGLLPRISGSQN